MKNWLYEIENRYEIKGDPHSWLFSFLQNQSDYPILKLPVEERHRDLYLSHELLPWSQVDTTKLSTYDDLPELFFRLREKNKELLLHLLDFSDWERKEFAFWKWCDDTMLFDRLWEISQEPRFHRDSLRNLMTKSYSNICHQLFCQYFFRDILEVTKSRTYYIQDENGFSLSLNALDWLPWRTFLELEVLTEEEGITSAKELLWKMSDEISSYLTLEKTDPYPMMLINSKFS